MPLILHDKLLRDTMFVLRSHVACNTWDTQRPSLRPKHGPILSIVRVIMLCNISHGNIEIPSPRQRCTWNQPQDAMHLSQHGKFKEVFTMALYQLYLLTKDNEIWIKFKIITYFCSIHAPSCYYEHTTHEHFHGPWTTKKLSSPWRACCSVRHRQWRLHTNKQHIVKNLDVIRQLCFI